MVALRGFLKQLFQWEWRSVPLSLAAVGCLVALWELVVERFDCIWTPDEDERLRLIPEPSNSVDRNAIAIIKEDQVVGHVPYNLALIVTLF